MKYPVPSPLSFVSYDTHIARAWDRSLVIAREVSFIISKEEERGHCRIVSFNTEHAGIYCLHQSLH